ncbi:hypothetical protein CCP1ISM_60019 [Azospirillaceae bacterium]
MINQELLNKRIIIQKKTMASLFHNYNDITDFEIIEDKIQRLGITAKEICLVVANFKCQRCGKEINLQHHHLISRKAKNYMDKIRYISTRYYWSNIIVLCKECHQMYHIENRIPTEEEEREVIHQETIDKIKKKYLKE